MICADWGLTRTVRPLKFPALERGLPRRFFLGFLAQLVEHPTFNRTVVSSNLTEPTNSKTSVPSLEPGFFDGRLALDHQLNDLLRLLTQTSGERLHQQVDDLVGVAKALLKLFLGNHQNLRGF